MVACFCVDREEIGLGLGYVGEGGWSLALADSSFSLFD